MDAPLFVTRDESLLELLLRLAAAAGVSPTVIHDPALALHSWVKAPLVIVGPDVAAALSDLLPPRRARVFVAAWAGPDPAALRHALDLGAEDVITLPDASSWVVAALTDLEEPTQRRALTIGVTGGCGGAGATSLVCALGQVAASHSSALVIDLDPHGPGVDRVLGVDDQAGVGWEDLAQSAGRLSARALREALPARQSLAVLTWRRSPSEDLPDDTARQALSAGQRGFDVVLLDLPRLGLGSLEEATARCDDLVVVTRTSVLAVAATARLCARLPRPARLVVRGRGGLAAGELAAITGATEVIAMAPERRLDENVDLGFGPLRARHGPLRRAATAVLDGAISRAGTPRTDLSGTTAW
jgi:secretion/DNA translocation related CpaE-like protein